MTDRFLLGVNQHHSALITSPSSAGEGKNARKTCPRETFCFSSLSAYSITPIVPFLIHLPHCPNASHYYYRRRRKAKTCGCPSQDSNTTFPDSFPSPIDQVCSRPGDCSLRGVYCHDP